MKEEEEEPIIGPEKSTTLDGSSSQHGLWMFQQEPRPDLFVQDQILKDIDQMQPRALTSYDPSRMFELAYKSEFYRVHGCEFDILKHWQQFLADLKESIRECNNGFNNEINEDLTVDRMFNKFEGVLSS